MLRHFSSSSTAPQLDALQVTVSYFIGIIGCISIILNLLLLYTTLRTHRRNNTDNSNSSARMSISITSSNSNSLMKSNSLILQTSICDLFQALLTSPIFIHNAVYQSWSSYSDTANSDAIDQMEVKCIVQGIGTHIFGHLSAIKISHIALIRYRMIVKRRRASSNNSADHRYYCLPFSVFSTSVSSITWYIFHCTCGILYGLYGIMIEDNLYDVRPSGVFCGYNFSLRENVSAVWPTLHTAITLLTVMCIIIGCYYCIWRVIRENAKIRDETFQQPYTSNGNPPSNTANGNESSHRRKESRRFTIQRVLSEALALSASPITPKSEATDDSTSNNTSLETAAAAAVIPSPSRNIKTRASAPSLSSSVSMVRLSDDEYRARLKMFSIVFFFFLIYLPLGVSVFQGLLAGHQSAYSHDIFIFLCLHINTLVNPILFILYDPRLKESMKEALMIHRSHTITPSPISRRHTCTNTNTSARQITSHSITIDESTCGHRLATQSQLQYNAFATPLTEAGIGTDNHQFDSPVHGQQRERERDRASRTRLSYQETERLRSSSGINIASSNSLHPSSLTPLRDTTSFRNILHPSKATPSYLANNRRASRNLYSDKDLQPSASPSPSASAGTFTPNTKSNLDRLCSNDDLAVVCNHNNNRARTDQPLSSSFKGGRRLNVHRKTMTAGELLPANTQPSSPATNDGHVGNVNHDVHPHPTSVSVERRTAERDSSFTLLVTPSHYSSSFHNDTQQSASAGAVGQGEVAIHLNQSATLSRYGSTTAIVKRNHSHSTQTHADTSSVSERGGVGVADGNASDHHHKVGRKLSSGMIIVSRTTRSSHTDKDNENHSFNLTHYSSTLTNDRVVDVDVEMDASQKKSVDIEKHMHYVGIG